MKEVPTLKLGLNQSHIKAPNQNESAFINASIASAIQNSDLLLSCLNTIISNVGDYEAGEITGIVKLTVAQVFILSHDFGDEENKN